MAFLGTKVPKPGHRPRWTKGGCGGFQFCIEPQLSPAAAVPCLHHARSLPLLLDRMGYPLIPRRSPMASILSRRVSKLEGGNGSPPSGPLAGDWAQYQGWDLMEDYPLISRYCTLEQFLIGRACWLARLCSRSVAGYNFWKHYQEPSWFTNAVYLSKPGSREFVAKERAGYPPAGALESYSSFLGWRYGQGVPWGESLDPRHHDLMAAAGIWLIDTLGLTPAQVIENYLTHWRAFSIGGLGSLADVTMPVSFIRDTPLLPIACVAESAAKYGVSDYIPWGSGLPYPDEDLCLLDMMMAASSGITEGTGGLYPAVGG